MLCLLPDVLLTKIYSVLKIKDKYNLFKSDKNMYSFFSQRFKKKYFLRITAIKKYFDSKIISLLGGTLTMLQYPILKFDCRIQDINSTDLPESIILGIISPDYFNPNGRPFVAFKIVKNYTYKGHLLFLEKDSEIIFNNSNDIEAQVVGTEWKFYTYDTYFFRTRRFEKFKDLDILPKFIQNQIVETEEDIYFHIL